MSNFLLILSFTRISHSVEIDIICDKSILRLIDVKHVNGIYHP